MLSTDFLAAYTSWQDVQTRAHARIELILFHLDIRFDSFKFGDLQWSGDVVTHIWIDTEYYNCGDCMTDSTSIPIGWLDLSDFELAVAAKEKRAAFLLAEQRRKESDRLRQAQQAEQMERDTLKRLQAKYAGDNA